MADSLADAVRSGDRTELSRAITLVESTRPDHREQAQELLMQLLPDAGHALHVGITGVPGVGKSTAIEALGMMLIDQGHQAPPELMLPPEVLGAEAAARGIELLGPPGLLPQQLERVA